MTKKPSDLSYLAKLAAKSKDTYTSKTGGKPGDAKLLLKDAMLVGSSHDAYADYVTYEVPFTGDLDEFSKNRLGIFFCKVRTANGTAGVGATWSVDEISTEFKFVKVTARYSIPD
jgi:hypothetical protein